MLTPTQFDPVIYLTNLWLVALGDSTLTAAEEAVLELVRVRIKAKKSDATKARKLAERGAQDVIFVGGFSDWVHMLEDLVAMHMAGSDGSPWSNGHIAKAAHMLASPMEDVAAAVEASARVAYADALGAAAAVACSNCQAPMTAEAKFCAQCGAVAQSATSEGGTRTALDVAPHGLTIAFAESTSGGFGQALDYIRGLPTFQQPVVAGKQWYAATWSPEATLDATQLARLLSGMRNRRVFVDGQERNWADTFGFVWCYERSGADNYCHFDEYRENPWGCRLVNMGWSSNDEWLRWGRFVSQNVFEFDKDRINSELSQRLQKVGLCPRLNARYANLVAHYLPSRVDVDGVHWDYQKHYGDVPPKNSILLKRSTEWGVEEIVAVGVKPVGRAFLDWLVQSARAAEQQGRLG